MKMKRKRKMSWLGLEETKTDLDSTLEIVPKEVTDTRHIFFCFES